MLTASRISTAPVDVATAAAIEAAEVRAWADLTAAVPPAHARRIGLEATSVGGVFVVRCSGGGFERGLFNRAIGLGVVEPTTRAAVERIVAGFRAAGVGSFVLPSQPHCRPADYEHWLAELGLRPAGAWDRVVRDAAPCAVDLASRSWREIEICPVTDSSVDRWAEFLGKVYRVDAGPWLRAMYTRPGWRHLVAYELGEIVAARSMYLAGEGELAFLAVDGPVPGVMTLDYEPDMLLCESLVADGVARGAAGFVADIEAPSVGLDTPAYDSFASLGFSRPYTRVLHALV